MISFLTHHASLFVRIFEINTLVGGWTSYKV